MIDVILRLVCGICWTVAYIAIIREGFKHRTCGMPLFALALNFTWELVHAAYWARRIWREYRDLPVGWTVQFLVILTWCLFDVVILYTYVKFRQKHFPKNSAPGGFATWMVVVFAVSLLFQFAFIGGFEQGIDALYSSFLMNLIMSFLFIDMLQKRKDTKGQSLSIAATKFVGTLAPTIGLGILAGNAFVSIIGISCAVLDVYYVLALNVRIRRENPGMSR